MDNNLKRKENESDFEYKVRICLLKLDRVINLEWDEIAELVDAGCSGTHLRKLSYAYREMEEFKKEHPNGTQEEIDKLNEKIREIEIKKIQIADEKRALKAVLREEARRQNILETLEKKMEELCSAKPMINDKANKIGDSSKIMCVLLSDLHYGSAFETAINTFNAEVAKERMELYRDKVIKLHKRTNAEIIYIELLGDITEQALHYTARIDSDKNVAEQFVESMELINEFIYSIAKETKADIRVVMVSGNHCRISFKKEESAYGETFTKILSPLVRSRFKNVKNVSFVDNEISDEIAIIKVFDKTIACCHGHRDRKDKAKDVMNRFLEGYDYVNQIHMGHTHQFESNRQNVIVNGSIKGADRYSQALRYSTKAEQVVIVYDEDGDESIHRMMLQ